MSIRPQPAKVLLLLIIACLSWLALALAYSKEIATSFLPLLRWEIAFLAPQYEVVDISIVNMGREAVIKMEVKTAYPRLFVDQQVPAGVPMESSTLVGHLLQPLIVMMSIVSVAAFLRNRNAIPLFLVAMPVLVAILMLDVPFVLVGALEDVLLSTLLATDAGRSPWVIWMNFINGGGRLALGIGAALIAIAAASLLTGFLDRHLTDNRPAGETPIQY